MNGNFAYMKHFLLFVLFFLGQFFSAKAQERNDWNILESATFKEIFVKEFYSLKSLLVPTEEILKLEGQEFNITGYYIPVATRDNSIILSKTPFANCFFCGSAGQETVIDVRLARGSQRNYIADDKIKVKGRLKINSEDWEMLSFVLEDASIVKDEF